MANAKLNLIRSEKESRQERELRAIRNRRTGENVPFGEGEIDNTPMAKILPTDEILRQSYRKVDGE